MMFRDPKKTAIFFLHNINRLFS